MIKPVVVVVVVVVVIHNLFSVSIFLQMICMGIQTYFSTSNREVVGIVIVVVVVQEVRKKTSQLKLLLYNPCSMFMMYNVNHFQGVKQVSNTLLLLPLLLQKP